MLTANVYLLVCFQEMEGAGGAGRMNFGREITGVDLKRSEVLRLLNLWSSRPSVKTLASEWLFPPILIKNFCTTGVQVSTILCQTFFQVLMGLVTITYSDRHSFHSESFVWTHQLCQTTSMY